MQAVFTAIGNFFTAILAKIAGFASWVLSVVSHVFVDLFEMVKDAAAWVFYQALSVAVAALAAINVPQFGDYWAGLYAETANVIALIHLDYCLGLVAACIVIRIGLQLIPFVRLGS